MDPIPGVSILDTPNGDGSTGCRSLYTSVVGQDVDDKFCEKRIVSGLVVIRCVLRYSVHISE